MQIRKQKGYQGANIEFSRVQLIYNNTLILTDYCQFQKEADCLSVNSLINRDPK